MECIETIKGRRSVRRFKAQPVGKEMIEELLDAARMAPSAGNLQARDFIVISNKITKQKLKEAALGQAFIEQAPLVIVAVANIERSSRVYKTRGELYAIQDATASVENILLSVSELLSIPHKTKPIAIIPVGYADEEPVAPPRMGLDKVVHWETW
ncbi:MAG: nitroreductase family protein [Candidatus Methanoperedens sp.]|nr:nitroreductase family protein [Candidatus Methanoperedens sp.]